MIHEDFIQSCFDRLKASYDTLCVLDGDKDSINCARQEAIRMVRVLTVLREYINECDSDYHEERTILPMSRYVWKSSIMILISVKLNQYYYPWDFYFLNGFYSGNGFTVFQNSPFFVNIWNYILKKIFWKIRQIQVKGAAGLKINLVVSSLTSITYLEAQLFWI